MSEPNNILRVDRLELRNFRCFARCPLDLHPALTVLVAENAGGKTAILDGLRLALSVFVTTVGKARLARGILPEDIRQAQDVETGQVSSRLPARFEAEGVINNERVVWSRTVLHDTNRARNSTKDLSAIIDTVGRLMPSLDRQGTAPVNLPVVAYYGTGRLFDEHRLTEGKRWLASENPVRASAYLDCLSPSSSYKSFAAWFGQTWDEVGDPRFRAAGFEARPENYITAVRDAVRTVLEPTGWTTIHWEPPDQDDDGRIYGQGYLAVEHPAKGKLPLSRLSDGIRNMVALVGDLAHRCARLNPHLGEGAPKQTPGIVLIDEVDMHLHPSWQQLVVGLLQTAFPNVQFILSTHSPHVLSTVDKESIRVISADNQGNANAIKPVEQTRGDESGNVLARAMHVDPVPDVGPARLLSEYRGLVQNGLDRSEQAQTIWNELVTHFGEGHHLLHEAAVLRDLQEFKREHQSSAGGAH